MHCEVNSLRNVVIDMIIIIQDPDLMAYLQDSGLIISHPHNLE